MTEPTPTDPAPAEPTPADLAPAVDASGAEPEVIRASALEVVEAVAPPLMLAAAMVARQHRRTTGEIAIAETEAARDIAIAETEAARDIAVAGMEAARDIAVAGIENPKAD